MDELTGTPDQTVLPSMQEQFNKIVSQNTACYLKHLKT